MLSSVNTIVSTLKRFYEYGVPSHILYFGDSLGDNLLLTTLCKALYDRGSKNIWIKCDHTFLFDNNPHIKLTIPYNTFLSSYVLNIFNVKYISPSYTCYQQETDRDIIPEKHIVLKMADCLGLTGSIENKPVLNLTDAEKSNDTFSLQQIVIVTSTAGAKFPMRNKEWIAERYQKIVDRFRADYQFIQLGTQNDIPLNNVLDKRGKTTVRESAAILKNSLLMISHVGFMMHLARAMDCPSVIIYGGREKPEQSGYGCFNNIFNAVECSLCWLHNRCDYQRKCLTGISAEMVEKQVLIELQNHNRCLQVDILNNG